MSEVYCIVEGHAEQAFIRHVLAPYLAESLNLNATVPIAPSVRTMYNTHHEESSISPC